MTVANPTPMSNSQPVVWSPDKQIEEQEGINPSKLWAIIRRRRLWFGVSFGLVLSVVGAVTISEWLTNPQYKGGFRMLVRDPLADNQQGGSSQIDAVARQTTSVNVPNLVEVLNSPMLLDPLAKQLGLPVGSLQGRVSISRSGRETDVLNVNLLWGNPEQGKKVVNALAQEYLAYSLRQRKEKLNQGLEFLDEQAPGLQQRVLDLQQQLAVFRRANTMLAPEEQSRALEISRAGLESELRTLSQAEAQLMGMLAMVRSGQLISPFQQSSTQSQSTAGSTSSQGNAVSNIANSFSPLLDELIQVEGELAKAQATYSNSSPVVRNLIARRDRLRPLLQRRETDALVTSLQVNRLQQQKVNDQFNSLGAEFRKNPELIKGYEALQQRLEVARDNLGGYLKAREDFRLEVAQSTVPWQVISPPSFGVIPVEPNLRNRLLQGLLAGLAAGTAVAYLRDRADRVFHSQRSVEEQLGLPVLGAIPYLPILTDRPISDWEKDLQPEERFAVRESLRSFYQSLRRLRASRTLRVVAITSSLAGEGKTSSTALLAQNLVEMGMKVLLVDADLRRARLHRRMGIDASRGWGELFGSVPPALDSLFQWVNPSLAVLPGGHPMPDPARLLSSPRCAEIIQQIREQRQFDLILFDTPPALELVDPFLIAEHMDGLILLVSMAKVNRDLPQQVLRKAREANVDMLGIITNQPVKKIMGYGYAGEYGYGVDYSPSSSRTEASWVVRGKDLVRKTTAWLDGEKPST